MKIGTILRASLAFGTFAAPAAAFAQPAWVPGAEITGQTVQVTAGGVTDNVTFSPGGQVTISPVDGSRVVNGAWSIANGNLCLDVAGAQECVPYSQPFQAGRPVNLTSSCGDLTTWLANAVNQPPPQAAPERG